MLNIKYFNIINSFIDMTTVIDMDQYLIDVLYMNFESFVILIFVRKLTVLSMSPFFPCR